MRVTNDSWKPTVSVLLPAVVLCWCASASLAATIVINNKDAPGVGFNDPTPWTPTGGNPATTIGQARLNCFTFAANIWGSYLVSSVPIQVDANFIPLTCFPTYGVLGQAGPNTVHRDFGHAGAYPAPAAGTYYPKALADAISGADLAPGVSDISAKFNSNIGTPGCLSGLNWYYGLDAKPPANAEDLVTVLLHEFAHGLGFLTFVNVSTGAQLNGLPDTFERFLDLNGGAPPLWPNMTDAQRAAAALGDPNLIWVGANVTARSGTLTAGLTAGSVRMYGPPALQQGSSVSHYHTSLTPDELMEPVYTGPDRNLCLTLALLQDIGWLTTIPANGLYMRDTPLDAGIEPNPSPGAIYESSDIYTRNQADGLLAANIGVHQNPIYSATQPNYVYVRVHNRGCSAASGQLKVYWTKGGTALPWPSAWVANIQSQGGCAATLFGDQIPATPVTVNLNPGADTIMQIPWMVPNPNDYACYGLDKGHFCLLARIETASTPPYGMTFPEGSDIGANTVNNNKIVWKNLTVVPSIPCGQADIEQGMIQNILSNQTAVLELRFQVNNKLTADTNAPFYQFGTIDVDLGPNLFSKWQAGGSMGTNVAISGTDTLRLLATNSFITNILMDPGEFEVLNYIIATTNQPTMQTPALFDLNVNELLQTNLVGTNATQLNVGGQIFNVNFNGIGIIPFGSTWRYWDLGFAPTGGWQNLGYDDSAWSSGPAQLGFGDTNDVTTINGGPATNHFTTAYFRNAFTMDADATADVSYLNFRLRADDGAVVYLNGAEVFRNRMPTGNVGYGTLAQASLGEDGSPIIKFTVPVGSTALTNGANVVAAEVHLENPRTNDLFFDLELTANLPPEGPEATVTNPGPTGATNYPPLEIDVAAFDTDGTVAKVEFYANLTKLGERTAAPFSLIVSNLAPGTYCISATVTDNLGNRNLSLPVALVVPAQTLAIARSNGVVTVSWPGGGILQRATNSLAAPAWFDVTNNPASPFTTPATQGQSYFRVRR